MTTQAKREGVGPDDLPSTWPDSLKTYSWQVASAIIRRWNQEARRESREFVILYVPRPKQWESDTAAQDSWKNPLLKVCADEDIDLVDPTERLRAAAAAGKEMYYDHFTVDGSREFAQEFVAWFKAQSRAGSPDPGRPPKSP